MKHLMVALMVGIFSGSAFAGEGGVQTIKVPFGSGAGGMLQMMINGSAAKDMYDAMTEVRTKRAGRQAGEEGITNLVKSTKTVICQKYDLTEAPSLPADAEYTCSVGVLSDGKLVNPYAGARPLKH